ncbi:MAG: hypothetical protein UH081_09145 [Clostridia bacterium]|nr:hypothetical protein [Clostridia bacterium]
MSDALDTLKGLLGNDAEGKISDIISAISNSSSNESESKPQLSAESLLQMKNMLSGLMDSSDDPRINLLSSLRPYMRAERQESIDSAIKLLGFTKLSNILNNQEG